MTTIPDHVGREAVRLLNAQRMTLGEYVWPRDCHTTPIITVAKLLMNPPAPMTDPAEEAAKRVLFAGAPTAIFITEERIAAATEQMRKEFAACKEAWEAGR